MKTQQTPPDVDDEGQPKPGLPEIEDAARLLTEDIELPPELVDGLLHAGSKLILGGSSKSFKTFTLLDLAMSIATGTDWWGRRTMPGRVLYTNLEIQRPFFARRIQSILAARTIKLSAGELDVWNLRGYAADINDLKPKMLSKMLDRSYALVILDPIYKCLGDRDENKTGDIASLMNELERLAMETGAAVAIGAHFSKGNQAMKESIDRIGGSGAFARDADSILIMTRHAEEDAFTIEATLRNFPPIPPFCVRWKYPVMELADELDPADLKQGGARSKHVPTDEEFVSIFPKNDDWAGCDPRSGLLSSAEITTEFKLRMFDKDALVGCRDRAEKTGKIKVIRGLPKNLMLAGLPEVVEAFKKQIKK
jgi:hypothetical protein